MDCEHFNNLLSAYIDRELSKRQTRKVEAHVAHCQRCKDDLVELQSVRGLLRNTRLIEPSSGFWPETLQRIQNTSYRPKLRVSVGLPFAVRTSTALAVVVLASLALLQFPRRELPPQRTIDPAQLVLWHADLRTDLPLADSGSMRFVLTDMRTNELPQTSNPEVD